MLPVLTSATNLTMSRSRRAGTACRYGATGAGEEESAEVNYSRRSPQGNRPMRRILNQAANAAVKHKGSIFQILYRRYIPRMGHNQTIGIIAHKLCSPDLEKTAPWSPL